MDRQSELDRAALCAIAEIIGAERVTCVGIHARHSWPMFCAVYEDKTNINYTAPELAALVEASRFIDIECELACINSVAWIFHSSRTKPYHMESMKAAAQQYIRDRALVPPTDTGRFSSLEPNQSNRPKEDDRHE
jgi:hypothetical protein